MSSGSQAPSADVAPSLRPRKPPPPPFALWGTLGFVVVTLVLAWDWEYGIGFSVSEIVEGLGRQNPILDGVRTLDWSTLTRPVVAQGFAETFQMAAIATILGGIVAMPLALLNSVTGAPNTTVYVLVM